MFVLASTYREIVARYRASENARRELLREWNALVSEINAKGGQDFLDGKSAPQLDAEDIKRLLMLCHPDRHDGKPMAVEMTQKLLALRDTAHSG